MRILLVEDDRWLSDSLVRLLKQERFAVEPAYSGTDGLNQMLYGTYDAVILDVMLPELDGFEVLRRARAAGAAVPVLMLTARGGLDDRVNGLNVGADYYLTKPFEKDELVAALRAVARRRNDAIAGRPSFGDASLSEKDGCLSCSTTGKSIRLSAKEYQLMELFLLNPSRILSKDVITERVWGDGSGAEYNNPEVYVSFLRKKMSFIGTKVRISTRRGLGYCLEGDEQ